MKAYKFTRKAHYDQGTFRLGTLYDYRREEAYGAAIGDCREGVFDRKHAYKFKTTDRLISGLVSQQPFNWMYAKGETHDSSEPNPYVLKFTSANVLIYSASLISDDFLFNEFEGSDCCVEIDDFEAFGYAMASKLGRRVRKALVRECVYDDRLAINDTRPMPPLTFLKDRRYYPQKEIRLCVEYHGDPTEPVIIGGLDLLLHCRVVKMRN